MVSNLGSRVGRGPPGFINFRQCNLSEPMSHTKVGLMPLLFMEITLYPEIQMVTYMSGTKQYLKDTRTG